MTKILLFVIDKNTNWTGDGLSDPATILMLVLILIAFCCVLGGIITAAVTKPVRRDIATYNKGKKKGKQPTRAAETMKHF